MATTVITVKIHGLGFMPVLIDDDGAVVSEVLAWMAHLRDNGIVAKTLYNHATGLSRFADYWRFQEGKEKPRDIFLSFFEALVHGCPALGWRGIETETAIRKVESVNAFGDWHSDQKQVETPNPKIMRALSWVAQAKRRQRLSKTNFLAFLDSSTKTQGKAVMVRSIRPGQRARRSACPEDCRPDRVFGFDDFNKLVAHERSLRERLAWLLLGAGGLRISEVTNLYVTDIRYDTRANEPRILLADPTYGYVHAPSNGDNCRRQTRQEYLTEKYNLVPRDQFGPHETHYAGWKSLRLHDTKDKVSEVFWLHPYFGDLFWKTHLAYLAIRSEIDPQHPWYLINIKNNVGKPVSISTLRTLLKRRCRRLGIESAQHPHALRHMYVDFLTNVLGISIADAQILVRHRCYESTEIYARASFEAKKRSLSFFMNKLPQPQAAKPLILL